MVGFGPDVYRTRDGGDTWERQTVPTARELQAVYFVDARRGWAVGDRGTILQTDTGGQKWHLSASPTTVNLSDVFFFDARRGWAVGADSTMVRTDDGGKTWRKSRLEPATGALTGVAFHRSVDGKVDGELNLGLMVSEGGGFFRTLDSGRSWLCKVETANPWLGVVAVNSLQYPEAALNFAVGRRGTFATCYHHDFDMQIIPGQPDLQAVDFIHDKVGWVVGVGGNIRKTSDGGKTWMTQNVRPFDLQAVDCVDVRHVRVLSEPLQPRTGKPIRRMLFVTNDGGDTWREVLVPSGEAAKNIHPPTPTNPEADAPLMVFVPRQDPVSNTLILPDRRPTRDEMAGDLTITACRGEYEPATVAVRSSVPLKRLFVHVSALQAKNTSRKAIPAAAVDVRWVKCWYQPERGGLLPKLLLKNDASVSVGDSRRPPYLDLVDPERNVDSRELQPLDLPARFTKQVWLTVHVPDQAEPGEYFGKIAVRAEGHAARSLNLQVQVLPFTLEPPGIDYGIYVNAEMPAKGLYGRLYSRTPEQMRSLLENLRAHGITHPYVAQAIALRPPSTDKLSWRDVKYDPPNLRMYLEMMQEIGFANDKLFWLNPYMCDRICYDKNETVGDPKLTKWPFEALMPTVDMVTRMAKEYGFGEVYFYGMDEVSGPQLEFQRKLFEMMRKADTPVPAKGFSACGSLTDVYDASICSQLPLPADRKAYQATGRKVYLYTNPVSGLEQPYTYRRNVGIMLYQFGLDGTGWWADYCIHGRNDFCFLYYAKDRPIDTLPWEGWREGCDDVRYLTTLRKVIEDAERTADAETRQTVEKAKTWLANFGITEDAQRIRAQAIEYILALTRRHGNARHETSPDQ